MSSDKIIKFNDYILQWNRQIIRVDQAPVIDYPNVIQIDVSNNNPNQWIVQFDTDVSTSTLGWVFDVSTVDASVVSVSGSGTSTVTFTTNDSAAFGDVLTASYDAGTGDAVDASTGVALQSFTDLSVNNQVEEAAWPTDGLIARWSFDDTIIDGVNSIEMTATDASAAYEAAKVTGNALTVDLTHSYETNDSTLGTAWNSNHDFTIVMWFTTQNANSKWLFNVSNTSDTRFTGFHLQVNAPAGSYSFNWQGIYGTDYTAGAGNTSTDWRQVILTYSSGTVAIYDNNVVGTYIAGSSNGSYTTDIGTGQNFMGLNMGDPNADRIGATGITYVYNRVITSAERAQLYNSGTPL